MLSTIALLLPLAVLCHGAALPQVIGSPIPSAKPSTYTFVIPCPPNTSGCVPRTITMVGGGDIPMTLLPREPQVLGDPIRTVILPTPPEPTSYCPSKTKHHHTTPWVDARQVLGSPTRSVAPVWSFPGWPWRSQSIVTVTITETVTQFPDTSTTDDLYTPGVTRTVPVLSVPIDKREPQVLGDPTRTVLLPTPTSTKKPHTSKKPTPTWGCDEDEDDVEKRQVLGSPTRTVILPPTPDPYPTITVTVTTTVFPTHPWPTKPSPPWWVTTRYPTSDPEPTTRTVPPLTVPISQRDPQVLGDPTRTVILPTPTKKPWPHTSKRPVTTWGDAEKRQELGDPTQSITWWEADDSEPTAPVVLEPPLKRAERREGRPRNL